MGKNRLWKFVLLISQVVLQIGASTHWVVTENGRIQSMLDSPFHLRRPYDLLALLDQETRRNEINNVYRDLMLRKTAFDKKSSGLEGASVLEARVYSQDSDCLKAGKLLSEIDLYTSIASNGSDREGVKLVKYQSKDVSNSTNSSKVPDCTKFYDLPYSMFTYEHLNAMRNRKNISLLPEESLKRLIPVSSVKTFGQQVAVELSRNNTSWLHYNLASLYWRIEGYGPKAVECARRALYFVPRQFRDIPLLNLAGIFHQSRHSKEAAILLHAAIEHDPFQASSHLALGNVYAVLADYNRSINCYDNFLKLQPGLEDVITAKHAILCHKKLETELLQVHGYLQDILSHLHYYHSQQQQWLRLKERLLWEQAPVDVQTKLESMLTNRGQRCVQKTTEDSKSTIMCDFIDSPLPSNAHVDIVSLLQNFETASKKINEHISLVKQSATKVFAKPDMENNKIVLNGHEFNVKDLPPEGMQKYPTTMSWKNNLYFDATGWPSREECVDWDLPLTEKEDLLLPVFMPPENKGYKVKEMLSEYINLPEGIEHELPWYPPICEIFTDEASMLSVEARELLNDDLKTHPYLRKILLSYVNNGNAEEAEIGQRIITAMQKKAGPTWVLATLASLYWRVRSNINNLINCLDLPFTSVPRLHADVMFISVGSIFHQLGLVDYALHFATFAFQVNYVEPSTNFLLALIHYTQNNPILAMYYMKNVLRVEPEYYDGQADRLLKIWACRIKLGIYEIIRNNKVEKHEMCAENEQQSEGVICSANGDMCHTATIHCFKTENGHESADEISLDLSAAKVAAREQCPKGKGQSLISTLLAAEGSGGLEPDQSKLESLPEKTHKTFHMRITLGDDNSASNSFSDFYVSMSLTDDPTPEAVLHVYDKSGTYQLSNFQCGDIQDTDLIDFTTMWQSVASRNVDIAPFLKPLNNDGAKGMEPFCFMPYTKIPGFLGRSLDILLNNPLPKIPEESLFDWLAFMANDHESSLEELGAKLRVALQENVTSWILNTAASIYWRVVGNAKEAAICLQHAMVYAPHEMRDIPLTNLANLLLTYDFSLNSLSVAQAALSIYPEFAVTHYTIGNIFNKLGELEKAISYYRSSLAIDPNFEPSRNRLVSVLCTFLFDENGILKENDILDN